MPPYARVLMLSAVFGSVSPLSAQPFRGIRPGCGVGGTALTVTGGFATPRLFPSLVGGFALGPPAPIFVGINNYPALPIVQPPIYFSPTIEPIDVLTPIGPLAGQPAGRFRPIGNGDRQRARQPAPVAAAPAPAPPPQPPNPKAEYAQFVKESRAAFAGGSYGRSAELFRRAITTLPDESEAHFWLAQSWIALGKYAEAAAEIHRGLRLDRTWPDRGPTFREMYAQRGADFEEHRRRLEDAARAQPGELVLQFVLGYVDWFDNRLDEARRVFAAIRPLVADPAIIDLFHPV